MNRETDERDRVAVLAPANGTHDDAAANVLAALARLGYDAHRVAADGELIESLRLLNPDFVFNALGAGDDDGGVPALLDRLGFASTGSAHAASTLAGDRHFGKKLIAAEGLPTPPWELFDLRDGAMPLLPGSLGLPLLIRPRRGAGNATLVRTHEEWAAAVVAASERDDDDLLAEMLADGRRFAVCMLGTEVMPVVEIVAAGTASQRFADEEATDGSPVRADVDDVLAERLQALGLSVHRLFGLRDASSVAIVVSHDGRPTVVAVDAAPPLDANGGFASACAEAGIGYDAVIGALAGYAAVRRDRLRSEAYRIGATD